ncbi:DUF1211 domain-containing protein [Candidatus Wolfebacteria bacterium]|nr:DUF1211 domain-containing protein [Candidatus Wolfebacteria bacterium]
METVDRPRPATIGMSPSRLDALADGIFAIVMTLLVLELRVPRFADSVSNETLWQALVDLGPLLMTYFLSFAVLFTYWRAHHYLMGMYAKTVDLTLMNINGLFFIFVALVPFTAELLGLYSMTQLAIAFYSTNIILIGFTIWWMRKHILFTDHVKSIPLDEVALRHGAVRTLLPPLFAAIAILVSFWSPYVSLLLLTMAVAFNLFRESTKVTDWLARAFHEGMEEKKQ